MFYFFLAVVLWVIALAILTTPKSVWTSSFDKLTKAKYRKDKANLQLILDNIRSFPEQWSISSDSASFPLESKAKQIYISMNPPSYSSPMFGDSNRKLDGFFGNEILHALEKENAKRETKALMRTLFPEIDSSRLLK